MRYDKKKLIILTSIFRQRGSIILSAFGVPAAAGAVEIITLSGTSGSPNIKVKASSSPTDARTGWKFLTDGTVDGGTGTSGVTYVQFQTGSQWSNFQPTPGKDYWLRATLDDGSVPNESSDALNSWLKLAGSGSANREFRWIETGLGAYNGALKIEIAEDSGGSTIVATGYYGGLATTDL